MGPWMGPLMSCLDKCRRLESEIRRLESNLALSERQVDEAISGCKQALITGDMSLIDLTLKVIGDIRQIPDQLRRALISEARSWLGVTEHGGDNKGPEVERFQRAVDGRAQGEPWCAAFGIFCIMQVEARHGVMSSVFRSELVAAVWEASPERLRLTSPEVGCLAIWQIPGTRSGHMEIVSDPDVGERKFMSIGGNTSDGSGVNRDGDGVYEKIRSIDGFGRLKVIGFLRVF